MNMPFTKRRFPVRVASVGVLAVVIGILPVMASAGVEEFITGVLTTLIYKVVIWPLAQILGALLYLLVKIATYNEFMGEPFVVQGWMMLRDLCNMFFVLLLLIIAIGTIVKWQKINYRQQMRKLILMAILINFSRTITVFLIDFSQAILLTFLVPVAQAAQVGILELLGISQLTTQSGDIITYIVASIFLIVTIVAVGVMVFIFIARIIALWLIIIFSPLAFLANVLPQTEEYYHKWWSQLSKNMVSGPVMAFMLWLILSNVGKFAASSVQSVSQASSLAGVSADVWLNFCIGIALLIFSMRMALTMGAAGGAVAAKWADKTTNAFKGARNKMAWGFSGQGGALGYAKSAGLRAGAGVAGGVTWAANKVPIVPGLAGAASKLQTMAKANVRRMDEGRDKYAKKDLDYLDTDERKALRGQGITGRRGEGAFSAVRGKYLESQAEKARKQFSNVQFSATATAEDKQAARQRLRTVQTKLDNREEAFAKGPRMHALRGYGQSALFQKDAAEMNRTNFDGTYAMSDQAADQYFQRIKASGAMRKDQEQELRAVTGYRGFRGKDVDKEDMEEAQKHIEKLYSEGKDVNLMRQHPDFVGRIAEMDMKQKTQSQMGTLATSIPKIHRKQYTEALMKELMAEQDKAIAHITKVKRLETARDRTQEGSNEWKEADEKLGAGKNQMNESLGNVSKAFNVITRADAKFMGKTMTDKQGENQKFRDNNEALKALGDHQKNLTDLARATPADSPNDFPVDLIKEKKDVQDVRDMSTQDIKYKITAPEMARSNAEQLMKIVLDFKNFPGAKSDGTPVDEQTALAQAAGHANSFMETAATRDHFIRFYNNRDKFDDNTKASLKAIVDELSDKNRKRILGESAGAASTARSTQTVTPTATAVSDDATDDEDEEVVRRNTE